MASKTKNLSETTNAVFENAATYMIGIVVSEYHSAICNKLLDGALQTLTEYGVDERHVAVVYAPGSFEIPLAARWLFDADDFDAIICLGCVIKGDTEHDRYINESISNALMKMSIEDACPYLFGVLTVNSEEQAEDRAGGKYGNKGAECATAALKMLALRDSMDDSNSADEDEEEGD
jgi:6,7-dimethyl-8-ribityllumazine synthase